MPRGAPNTGGTTTTTTAEEIPVNLQLKVDGPEGKDSELLISGETQMKSYVEGISESNNGTSSADATALSLAKKAPVLVNEWRTSVSTVDTEVIASEWTPLEKYSFDLAQLSWLRGDDVTYQNRTFSLIIGFTTGRIWDAKKTTTTTYGYNNQSYSNGTSSSNLISEREDVALSLGDRDGGCGASLAFNVYKEYESFSVTFAMGVAYGFMTDEAKQLVKQYATKSNLSYFPATTEMLGGKMTFVNSTDVVDGAFLGISFNF